MLGVIRNLAILLIASQMQPALYSKATETLAKYSRATVATTSVNLTNETRYWEKKGASLIVSGRRWQVMYEIRRPPGQNFFCSLSPSLITKIICGLQLANKLLPAGSISEDNTLGWEIVLKLSHLPSKRNVYFLDNLSAAGVILRYTSRRKGFIYQMSTNGKYKSDLKNPPKSCRLPI